eukprot:c14057_g1_i1.p1 GENE.c14057_g1_i1~~c14057_g1_i1.p1  ORF type:complete len:460 (+),score=109.76 c14057_g1_i1:196-1575(+)
MCERMIKKAIETMEKQQVLISRAEWLRYATECETAGSIETAKALVVLTLGMGVDEVDRRRTWVHDAESFLQQGFVHVARAVYGVLLEVFPTKRAIWLDAVELERKHRPEAVGPLLERATTACPKAEMLWLMWAKYAWLEEKNVVLAREILDKGFQIHANSDQLWLAAVKLEYENDNSESARKLLAKARERAGTARVWMKSAKLEREVGNLAGARELATQGIKLHPDLDKLWLIAAQVEEAMGNVEGAKEILLRAVRRCINSIPCWLCLAALHQRMGQVAMARSVLERARIKNPQSPELWIASVALERDGEGNQKLAETVLAQALQDCPKSGKLLALAIEMAPRPQKRSKSMDALNRCDDAHVVTAVAKLFWMERRIDKARKWFNRAVSLQPDLGDAWATFYKFEVQESGDQDSKAQEVLARCKAADPHHGDAWCAVSKKTENAKLSTEQILMKVALSLP